MLDVQLTFVGLSICAALTALWTMQCVTVEAGFSSRRRFAIFAMRISLAALALSILLVAFEVAASDLVVPDIVLLAISSLLVFLVTLPFAIGGRAGGTALAHPLS